MRLRPEFVSVSQRVSDPETRKYLEKAQQTITFYQNPKLNKNWKKDCRGFRKWVKTLKEKQSPEKETIPEETEQDDRIKCPVCGRKFNKDAFERHFPICERNH